MKKQIKRKIISITPLVSLIIFLTIGFLTNTWNPTWVVFLLIPLVPALLNTRRINLSYTFVVALIYITYGLIAQQLNPDGIVWHPTWIIFLTIPIFYILFPHSSKLTIWQSKEEKERQKKKKEQKSRYEEIKKQFFGGSFGNDDSSESNEKSADEEPEVEVIFDRKKDK